MQTTGRDVAAVVVTASVQGCENDLEAGCLTFGCMPTGMPVRCRIR